MKTKPFGNTYIFTLFFLCVIPRLDAQPVEWLSFEQLEDSLKVESKPVLIDFYTSWCTYCRKMDRVVFTKPEIEKTLHQEYYTVKMDVETTDTIVFDGQTFINSLATKKRKGIHDLAILLAQRNGQFAPPTILFLDKNFKIKARYFEYLDSKSLLHILNENKE